MVIRNDHEKDIRSVEGFRAGRDNPGQGCGCIRVVGVALGQSELSGDVPSVPPTGSTNAFINT